MKDNNKRVFLGIIAIATLIIAIMGATFAFFSASGGSANNAVTANATTLANLGFTSSHSKIATDLVPVSSESEYFSRYPGIASSGAHSCLDDVGNQICSIYEFTVTNTASVAQTIYVSFVPNENTFDNMYFAAFNTSIASANYTVATGSSGTGSNFVLTPATTASNSTLGHTATKLTKNSTTAINMAGLSTSLASGASVTYTILVWLQETGDTQNTEQGGVFKAGVNVTTGGNSTGVTGIMEDSGNFVYTVNQSEHVYIGQAIPNDVDVYQTASSAMDEFNGHVIALKHKITNDVVSESYIIFIVTPEMVSTASVLFAEECNNNPSLSKCQSPYQGMTAGTYTIKGGDGGTAYSTNVSTLTTAFGSSNCLNNSFIDGFDCGITDLGASTYLDGNINMSNGSGSCSVRAELYSDCYDD